MSVFHCGMGEVNVLNNICIVWSRFPSHSRERAGCFPLLFLYVDSDLFSSLLSVEWHDSSIAIASASLVAFILSAEIITLVSRVMKFALSSQNDCLHIQMILWHPGYLKKSLDSGFRPWYLCWFRCQRFALKSSTCGQLQTMQASSALGHCVSVKPIMPPSQRSAVHALGHG